jgi:hypothetical protein
MAMQTQMRGVLRILNCLVHEETAATAAAARRSAAGEALREHRPLTVFLSFFIYPSYRGDRLEAKEDCWVSRLILNTSAPFAISGFSIQIKNTFGLFVMHNKPQFLTLRNHLVPTLQTPNFRIFLGY